MITSRSVSFLPKNVALSSNFVSSSSSSSTSLSMGVVEEFITGRDAETRRNANEIYLSTLRERVNRINDLESTIEELSDEEA